MKFSHSLFLIPFAVTACASHQNGAPQPIKPSAQISNKSVWEGNAETCLTQQASSDCLINKIKESGTPEAVKSAELLKQQGRDGYVSSFKKVESVGIATITYPFRANTNTEDLLIPTTGQFIDTSDIMPLLNTNKNWLNVEKKNPQAMVWFPGEFYKNRSLGKTTELIYRYPIKACHACSTLGSVDIGYVFTHNGEYIKSEVIEIKQ